MKTILSVLACVVASSCLTVTGLAQAGETTLQKAEALKIIISGVPGNDQQSMQSQTFIVSNDGNVRVTYLKGDVRAAGLTPTQLARSLENAYKAAGIYTNPTINVSRLMTADTQQVVTVNGNVRQPGNCFFRSGMTINDAIAERGGFDEFAKKNRVRLMRKGKTTEHDLRNISAHQENNVVLEPGDSIIVPQGF